MLGVKFGLPRIGLMLGWQDLKQAYRRSAIGPFWLTIGMLVQIVTMALVFGLIFKSELDEYLPFLAVGIIVWGLISNSMTEGCQTFIFGQAIIRELNIPLHNHVIRTLWRNLLTTGHNMIILPLVFLAFMKFPGWALVAFMPGLLLLIVNLSWVIWLLGTATTRYRDVGPIVSSLSVVAFYLTPVMWYPSLIGDNSVAHFLLGLNPFYHWLQLVRLPLLGTWPTAENWGVAVLSACLGWLATIAVIRRYRSKIAFWV